MELFQCTLGHRATACRGAPYTHLARMNVSCDTFGQFISMLRCVGKSALW